MITFPNSPVGLTKRTTISDANTMASDSSVEIYAFDILSSTPSQIPPTIAPGMEPIPPKTAATKALIPGIDPVKGPINP